MLADARALLADVVARRHALAAFNVANMETIQAVIAAAEERDAPVILQVSPGAIEYAGYETITRLALNEAVRTAVPAILHLDHCRDPALIRRAIEDGFTSVMFDGSRLPHGDNARITFELVSVAHSRNVLVEAELGLIEGSESVSLNEARREVTTAQDAHSFVEATGIDLLAPAVGTLHRMPDDAVSLDIDLVRSIARASGRPLALHGGSGVRRDQLPAAIHAGVAKLNISSRVGRAFAAGIRQTWEANPHQFDLRRYLGSGRERVRVLAGEYLDLCRGARASSVASAPAAAGSDLEPE